MKFFVLFITIIGVVSAAPAQFNAAVSNFKAEILNPLMEETCLDMSKILCSSDRGHKIQYGVYEPGGKDGPCGCSELPSPYIVNSRCSDLKCPKAKPDIHVDISEDKCFCSAKDRCNEPANFFRVDGYPRGELKQLQTVMFKNTLRIQDRIDKLKVAFEAWNMMRMTEIEFLQLSSTVNNTIPEIRILTNKLQSASNVISRELKAYREFNKRQEPTSTVSSLLSIDTAVPTFVPPPKVDITPELLSQSLNSQLQNEAIADSVIPDFLGGNLTYLVQMDGIVASRIPINASTFLACDGIGTGADVNIMIVPKNVQDGTPQTTVADCMVIAVNMYTPNIITYWVQTSDGVIATVAGSNKVHDIDQMYTGGPLALSLRASTTSAKRTIAGPIDYLFPKIWKVEPVKCEKKLKCPDHLHDFIQGPEDLCGCLTEYDGTLYKRGISKPDVGEATMTAEACAAMKCINNNNRPANFNPFSRTCWCQDPVYVEEISSGWAGRVRSLIKKYFI